MDKEKAPYHRIVVDRVEFFVPDRKMELVKALLFEVCEGANDESLPGDTANDWSG